MTIYLFYHNSCPNCPAVKAWLRPLAKELNIQLQEIDVMRQGDYGWQVQSVPAVGIPSVPRILLTGPNLTAARIKEMIKWPIVRNVGKKPIG